MEKISIKSNLVRLQIEKADGTDYDLVFNPEDLMFINNMYGVYNRIEKKQEEYTLKMNAVQKDKSKDKHGIPNNISKQIEINLEYANYLRDEIDHLFGSGTCQNIFGDARDFKSMLGLIEGVMPYVTNKRNEKMQEYLDDESEDEAIVF